MTTLQASVTSPSLPSQFCVNGCRLFSKARHTGSQWLSCEKRAVLLHKCRLSTKTWYDSGQFTRSNCLVALTCLQSGDIVYRVTGVVPAPTYFSVDESSGEITLVRDLTTDRSAMYTVSALKSIVFEDFGV